MPSAATNAGTRREWRALGFHYERDDAARCWRLTGTRAGLGGFAARLRRYAADPRNALLSEHVHLGPYMYLKVMTWTEPRIDGHAIAGRLEDLARLAGLVEAALAGAALAGTGEGARLTFRDAWAPGSPYELALAVAAEGFDPAEADPACRGGA